MRQKVGEVSRKLPKWQVAEMVFGRSDLKASQGAEILHGVYYDPLQWENTCSAFIFNKSVILTHPILQVVHAVVVRVEVGVEV